jgi:hypothetical protein
VKRALRLAGPASIVWVGSGSAMEAVAGKPCLRHIPLLVCLFAALLFFAPSGLAQNWERPRGDTLPCYTPGVGNPTLGFEGDFDASGNRIGIVYQPLSGVTLEPLYLYSGGSPGEPGTDVGTVEGPCAVTFQISGGFTATVTATPSPCVPVLEFDGCIYTIIVTPPGLADNCTPAYGTLTVYYLGYPFSSGSLAQLPLTWNGASYVSSCTPQLTISSGNQQTGAVGQTLGSPLTVQLNDPANNPLSIAGSIRASFQVTQQPAGASGAISALANYDGSATQLTLGTVPGQYQVTASCSNPLELPTLFGGVSIPISCSPASVVFTETAILPLITIVAGTSGQTGNFQQALNQPLQVQTTPAASGIPVTFSIAGVPAGAQNASLSTASGAPVTTTIAMTGPDGIASLPFVMGDLPGTYQITASCTGCSQSPVTFTETGVCGYSWTPARFTNSSPDILFGYVPTENDKNINYCASMKAGCALASAANMFSTLQNPNSVSDPILLNGSLTQLYPYPSLGVSLPSYGTGTQNYCTIKSCQTPPPYPPYPEQCEFGPAWIALPRYAPALVFISSGAIQAPPGSNPNLTNYNGTGVDAYLQNHVCMNGDRVILDLTEYSGGANSNQSSYHGHHFVLVTGQATSSEGTSLDWNVFDPGWIAAPTTLSEHIAGFTASGTYRSFTVAGARTYREYLTNAPSPFSLGITANSPVELLLMDPQGRLVGNLQPGGPDVNQVPQASYLRDDPFADDEGTGTANGDPYGIKTVYIPAAVAGSYSLQVTGTASGSFLLTFSAVASDGSLQNNAAAGTTTLGNVANYQLQCDPTPGAAIPVSPALAVSLPPYLPAGTLGASYPPTTVSATAGSGNYTWSAAGLPNGLTIGASTGAITGTPTSDSGSPFSVMVTVTDGSSATSTRAYSMAVSPFSPCDVNQDGTITVADVQQIVNQALGVLTATADLNDDGAVNVADIQIVINAVLGLACPAF